MLHALGMPAMHDRTGVFYTLLGLTLSIAGTLLAFTRAHFTRSFYAEGVYHMTSRSHRRFAAASAAFGAGFIAALRWPAISIPLLAVYTLSLVFYLSSFARGFSDEDE